MNNQRVTPEIKLCGTHPVHSSLHLHNIPDYTCSCKILCYLCSSYWHRTCVFPRRTHLRLENEQAVKSKENRQRKEKCTLSNDLENTAALVTAPTMQAGRLAFQEPPVHHIETWFARLPTTVIFFFSPSRTKK